MSAANIAVHQFARQARRSPAALPTQAFIRQSASVNARKLPIRPMDQLLINRAEPGLNDAVHAGAARVFWATRDDDTELRRVTFSRSDRSSRMRCRQPPQAQHAPGIPNPALICLWSFPTEPSCRSYSMFFGALVSNETPIQARKQGFMAQRYQAVLDAGPGERMLFACRPSQDRRHPGRSALNGLPCAT